MTPPLSSPPVRGESNAHKRLKALAFQWAREQGLRVAATEVVFPHRRMRVDVASFKPTFKVPPTATSDSFGVTAIFECKQARSDLVKDNARRNLMGANLVKHFERKAGLEKLLQVHLPHLAKGETLFPEIDAYNFEHLQHKGYAKTLRAIQVAQNKLAGGTKFDRLLSYRMANLHYVVTTPNIVEEHEVPLGWGWLVQKNENLTLRRPPTWFETTPGVQQIFIQRIAAAGTTAIAKHLKTSLETERLI